MQTEWEVTSLYSLSEEKIYVAVSSNAFEWKSETFILLSRHKHPSLKLQKIFDDHGETDFEWEVDEGGLDLQTARLHARRLLRSYPIRSRISYRISTHYSLYQYRYNKVILVDGR